MEKKKEKEKLSLNFEIRFFEKLVKDNPDFVDALIPLAEAYTKAGRYREGLTIDKQLSGLKPDDQIVYYNLACSYSLLKEKDEAFAALKKAIKLGYRDFKYMDNDPDLSMLRDDQRYQEIILKVKNQKRD